MKLSILVPILNEKPALFKALHRLKAQLHQMHGDVSVILCDGGSTDGSKELGEGLANAYGWSFVSKNLEDPSIGRTLNLGLRQVESGMVFVLPMDCKAGTETITKLISFSEPYACGGFWKTYSPTNGFLNLYASLQNWVRSLFFKQLVWTNGIFFDRELIEEFPQTGFMEDVELSDQLRHYRKWKFIISPIQVSSRRYYPNRVLVRALLNLSILFLYRTGLQRNRRKLKNLYQLLPYPSGSTGEHAEPNNEMFDVPKELKTDKTPLRHEESIA